MLKDFRTRKVYQEWKERLHPILKMQLDNEERGIGVPKTDEERVKTHFKISDEDWKALSPQERQSYIDKLPPRGSGL